MHRREAGAALVEAAIVFPFVILLVFGTIDIARGFFDAAKVQEAAEEGAFYVALHPNDTAGAVARAEEAISSPSFIGAVVITCPSSDQVSVTVSYTMDLITPFIVDSVDLTHTETARVLRSDPCVPLP